MSKKTLLLVILVLVKFVLQYTLVSPYYDLQRDEYLHLDQGRHLAWGYISVPPLTSWISVLIRWLGNGVFWVKFFPALFGVLTLLLLWKIMEELKGGLFALALGSLAILVSVVLRINILYQPNSIDIFFWTLVYFTLIKYVSTNHAKWLYAAALAAAFGFLGKYNIIFLLLGLLPALLLTEQRRLFMNRHFYGSLILAFIIISPNLVWQYQNHFPTVRQLKELADTQLVNVNRIDFVKDQFLFFLSAIFLLPAALISLWTYAPFKKYRFIFWSFFFSMALFIFFKAKSYYSIGLYPVLLAFGALYWEKLLTRGWRRWLRPVSLILVAGLSIPFILIAFPLQSPAAIQPHLQRYKALGLLRWEDGRDHNLPQDFADMTGWKELAEKVDAVYSNLPRNEHIVVLCDNYGQAGAINYYSKFAHINAVSFNADYIDWMPLERPVRHVIQVKDADDEDSARTQERPLFDTVRYMACIENPYAREQGTRIFLLQGAKADINARLEKERTERKAGKKYR